MKKFALIIFSLLIFTNLAHAQKSKFTGQWEVWWDKTASKGVVIKLKEKNGRVTGTAFGAIPRLYECEIKSTKISGNSFTGEIEDDWGNTGTVKITVSGRNLSWRVLKSKIKSDMTFPLKADLKRRK
jgi:hypothetical protein